MTLIRFDGVSLDIGDQKILTEADLAIEPGERVCLIGRNGAGKSTTFRLITEEMDCDQGEIVRKDGLLVSQLEQHLPHADDMPVREVVRSGLTGIQALLDEYHERSGQDLDKDGLRELEGLGPDSSALDGIVRVVSVTWAYQTPSGLGFGSTKAEVEAAWPGVRVRAAATDGGDHAHPCECRV